MIETETLPTLAGFNIQSAQDWLRQRLSPERFTHSRGAHDKAVDLAERFGFSNDDCHRAAIAGLLHDAAKLLSPPELIYYCQQHQLPLSSADQVSPQTLHPFVGAHMVAREFGLADEIILNAIRYHTTGRAGMHAVEKVVYIADKIEGNTRNPLYIKKMTAALDFKDPDSLDVTMLFLLDSTIAFLIEKHQILHPRTVEARNDFVARLRQSGKPIPPL